jgi:aspartyl-tRNA(Asn)/glutamyl-tRNA(Gln) amidotransferase subunit A
MAGYDPEDPRAVDHPIADPLAGLGEGMEGLRVGVPEGVLFEGLDPDVERGARAAAATFADLGAEVVEVSVPGADEANEICTLMIRADALALHRERYEAQPELFGDDVRRRLALGEQVSGADYAAMVQRMYEWRRTVRRLFEEVDLVLTATTSTPAPRIDASEMIATTARLTRLTHPWSLANLPAISLPCGLTEGGLPVGLQLGAAPWQEAVLLRAGAAYQRATDWHLRRPPAFVPAAA